MGKPLLTLTLSGASLSNKYALPSKISTIIEHKMAYRNDISAKDTNIKEIYSRNKKRRGKSKYLLTIGAMVGKENPIPAKIVCVRNIAYPMMY